MSRHLPRLASKSTETAAKDYAAYVQDACRYYQSKANGEKVRAFILEGGMSVAAGVILPPKDYIQIAVQAVRDAGGLYTMAFSCNNHSHQWHTIAKGLTHCDHIWYDGVVIMLKCPKRRPEPSQSSQQLELMKRRAPLIGDMRGAEASSLA